jgi:hypothetical protein
MGLGRCNVTECRQPTMSLESDDSDSCLYSRHYTHFVPGAYVQSISLGDLAASKPRERRTYHGALVRVHTKPKLLQVSKVA